MRADPRLYLGLTCLLFACERHTGVRTSTVSTALAPHGTTATPHGTAATASRVASAPLPLRVREIGQIHEGSFVCVLLHGFGAPGDDLVGLSETLHARTGWAIWVPEAPILMGPGRAWFSRGASLREPAVQSALQQLRAVVAQLGARGVMADRIVLGGFSQGGMLSAAVALSGQRLAGLVVLSGKLIPGVEQLGCPEHMPRVLLAHGNADAIIAKPLGDALAQRLSQCGADVERVDFDGGHAISEVVQTRLAQYLASVATTARRSQ